MAIPTEMIGSIPRPAALLDAMVKLQAGAVTKDVVDALADKALRDTIERLERTGSPVLSDGEQTKPSFATYPLHGLTNLAADGVVIPFADGHVRQLPRLTAGPFRYGLHAERYVRAARAYTALPIKQAVISASAMSLLYPAAGIAGYGREEFIADLLDEAEEDIRGALEAGAASVQIDFTEGRLSLKLDPTGGLLRSFIALNNQVLARFGAAERERIGVHVCPGGDRDSTHSADVPYAELLPAVFGLEVGRVYLQMASEGDRRSTLKLVGELVRPGQKVFIGVIDPIDAAVEAVEMVRNRVVEAAAFVPHDQLGTTDDCGFAPFADDMSTAREIAFAKIRARVEGTALAGRELGIE